MLRQTVIQFGVYEVDLGSGELLKDGTRLRIQEQPLKVLGVLLEHPGELVSREQLKQAIAPDSPFGDFDHALNVAVAKLRTALNDPAEHPVYIETLHKRGYRFIAPLNGGVQRAPITSAPTTSALTELPRRTRRVWWAAAAVIVLLIAIGIALWLRRESPRVYQATVFTTLEGYVGIPAISPDGNEVAFVWSKFGPSPNRIYVQTLGSVVARPLVDDAAPEHTEGSPAWFRDGRTLAYWRKQTAAAPREIWTVPRTGGTPVKLLEAEGIVGFDVAPDGKSVVTAEEHPKGVAALYLVSLADMSRQQLTRPENKPWGLATAYPSGDVAPRFCPDGRRIAFLRREGSGADLYLVSAKGGEPERLSDNLTPTSELAPSFVWGPDGKSLVVSAVRPRSAGARTWWRFWLSGKRWEGLSIGGSNSPDRLTISADGRRLAFLQSVSRSNIYRFELPRADAPSGEPLNVTQSTGENGGGKFSPDGGRIAFASKRTGHWEIYAANSDGSRPIQLTRFQSGMTGSPMWSHDGEQIAFDSRPTDHSQIYTINANGGTVRQMTFSDDDAVLPVYSHDGRWIYFARVRQGGSDVWKLPANGGAPVFVVAGALFVEVSMDGNTLYYTKATDKEMAIYSRQAVSGTETLLFREKDDNTGNHNPFVVVKDGIFYRRRLAGVLGNEHDLMFYNFASRDSELVLHLPFGYSRSQISVSPDRRYILLVKPEQQNNIMLVEDFR